MREVDEGRGLWRKGCGKGIRKGDCGKRDSGTVGKGIREVDEGRGLWRKGCEKGMRRGDCAEGDEGSG